MARDQVETKRAKKAKTPGLFAFFVSLLRFDERI
jgi:hypothetical protein